jgi:hypothetical protein
MPFFPADPRIGQSMTTRALNRDSNPEAAGEFEAVQPGVPPTETFIEAG